MGVQAVVMQDPNLAPGPPMYASIYVSGFREGNQRLSSQLGRVQSGIGEISA
jgi:hypothetical protein